MANATYPFLTGLLHMSFGFSGDTFLPIRPDAPDSGSLAVDDGLEKLGKVLLQGWNVSASPPQEPDSRRAEPAME